METCLHGPFKQWKDCLIKGREINWLDIKIIGEIIIYGRFVGSYAQKPERIAVIPKARTILISAIVSGVLLAFVNLSQGKARTLFVGFRHGEKSNPLPEGWEVISYFRTVKNGLSLSKEGKRTVLEVKSVGSASALLKGIYVDLNAFPLLVWRWKINRVIGMAIESRKDRNDAAARVRVIFGKGAATPSRKKPPETPEFLKSFGFKMGGKEPRGFKIDYIWGNTIAKGEVLDFPGSRNHKTVIVESGNKRANRWLWEERNVIEDFEQCFRRTPPHLIGIVVLTDTNQTNEGVIAYYSSITLMSK